MPYLPTLYLSVCESQCPGTPQAKKPLHKHYAKLAEAHNAKVLTSRTPDAGFDLAFNSFFTAPLSTQKITLLPTV